MGDVEKLLSRLPPLTPMQIVDRMKTTLEINETFYDLIAIDGFEQQCQEFGHFHRQVMPLLKGLLKDVSAYMNATSQGILDYKNFLSMLDKYEGLNYSNYVDENEQLMIFGSEESG